MSQQEAAAAASGHQSQQHHHHSHQQRHQQRQGNNTTNLTLNMNFNLQQSTIQVQPMQGQENMSSDQRMFQSPRSSQSPMQQHSQQHQHQQMTPVQNTAYHAAFKGPEIQGLKSSSPKTYKLAQIRGRSDKSDSLNVMQGAISPPAMPSNSKVKKIKVNKLSADQLNQIRASQHQSKVGSASIVAATHPNQGLMQHEQIRTGSVGRHSTYAQMALNMQHQQQALQQHGIQMSPQNPSGYLQQVPMHHHGAHGQPLSEGASMQTQKFSGSNMSARQSKNFTNGNQSPSHPHQIESDSKLGRKGERPTVAQILEIGVSQTGQNWMDTDRAVPQQLSRLTLNSVPMYNATVTSNFDSLGRNSIQVPQNQQKHQKGMKGQLNSTMEQGRQPQIKGGQPPQQSLNLPQFRRMRKSKNRKHESEDPHLTQEQVSNITRISNQTLNNTTAAASHAHSQSRAEAQKLHYSEGGRIHNGIGSPGGYTQSHPTTFIPLLLDVNSRSNNQAATAATQQQLFTRLQQQLLPQATMIRHPQMGELPVIQMTSAQLQMVQQAAQNRQNFQQDSSQQASDAQSTFHTMAQMLAAQGLPSHSQLAFAIQVSDAVQPPQQHQQPHHSGSQMQPGHIGSPMSNYASAHQHPHYQQLQQQLSQQQQQQHCQLPSLRHQNHMTSMQQLQQQQQAHQNQTLSPNQINSAYQMMSQAPIKKMTLNSRGKSMPRSTLQIEGDSSQVLLDKIQAQQSHPNSTTNQSHQQQQITRQQFQQQQFQDFVNHSGYQHHPHAHQQHQMQSSRIGNSFFQSNQLQPIKGGGAGAGNNGTENAQIDFQTAGLPVQPPLLAPIPQKGHRKSMQFAQSPDPGSASAAQQQHQRDVSQQSRRHPAIQHHYAKLSHNASNAQQSRNLASQSDRGSGRSGKQATSNSNLQPGNVYVAYKGPLSDLIMTQQSNLNMPKGQSGSGMRLSKQRQKSSSITINSTSQAGEPPESSSHQDVNGGIPYIFENQKISQAINQEEFKVVKQHMDMGGAPSIIIGELIDLDSKNQQAHQQPDFVPQEPKTNKKKGKGRKGGFNSSQNQKLLSKSSVDTVRLGQRQFSQQPHAQAQNSGMQHGSQDQRKSHSIKDKKKKFNQNSQSGNNHTLVQSHPESSYLEQQQQQLLYQEETYAQMAQHTGQQSITPQNLKPNIQLKQKKVVDSHAASSQQVNGEGVQGSNEPSLGQHGLFVKTLTPACSKYYNSKNNTRMTPHKYKNGISNRLLVAKETFAAKRAKLPILVLNIDGVLGYFDEQKNYNCRERSLQMLQSLSHNYKIVGFSHESKGIITRFGRYLSEYKTPFAFDAVYQIQRKPVQNQNRVNLTQVILDFSGDDEEDLDMFVSSQLVFATCDKMKLKEKFESMDLREVFDYDKEYLKGEKAPLIIRVPHARCRPMSSLTFETLFQLLTCLLVSSKLSNLETTSLFTYNDRTKGLSIPTSDKGIVSSLLPEKMKLVEKSILSSKSLRFVMGEPPHGSNFHKGFKQLTEVYRGTNKPDWLDFNYRIFKPLLPIRMRLQKITQLALQGAQPPTGKKLMVRCETEEATRKYQVFCKKNEIIRKQIRKYRARYWAVNQIEDSNLEEENQDIVGDLLDEALVATTFCDVVPGEDKTAEESAKPGTAASNVPNGDEETKKETAPAGEAQPSTAKVQATAEGTGQQQPDAAAGPETAVKEDAAAGEVDGKLGGGACSSSSEASDSDNEHYDEEAQAVKFKVIDIKHCADNEGGATLKRQQTVKAIETNKPVKIECRKIPKPKTQYLLEFFSKKQNSMMFTTNQQQHLQGAQALQIENQISELVQKLNEADKAGKKEVYNYDF